MQQTENDILKRVRKIEIKTRGLSNEIFAGKYHTAFRGRGMSFSEVREYRAGDDVRDIDWNVTARSRKPHIKVYEEERELTMMLVVDVSASRMFGTTERLKKNIITEIAAVLAFSASENNDKVGCIFFSDRIEKFIPPKKGRSHILTIIRELVGFRPESRGTKLSEPIRFLTNVNKKRCTTFILSDFMDSSGDREALDDALKIAQGKHDLVGIRVYDPREAELPDVGIVELRDAETGRKVWVDTSSRAVREHYAIFCPEEHAQVLARKRSLALALLESLSEFDAFLTGAVLNGCAHEESNIVLDVFCDDVKLVEAALIDRRIEFEPVNSPRSAMPEPLESLGALIFSPRTHEAEGVRFDVRASIDRSRNPFRRHPDAHQASWEAQGRINAAGLRAALESLES